MAVTSTSNSGLLGKEIVILDIDKQQNLPAVAFNLHRNEYLIVWHSTWDIGSRDIRGQRVNAHGQSIGEPFTVYEHTTKDSAQPSVAYDPVRDRYLVVWEYDRPSTSYQDIHAHMYTVRVLSTHHL
jgi:hypothetical protein